MAKWTLDELGKHVGCSVSLTREPDGNITLDCDSCHEVLVEFHEDAKTGNLDIGPEEEE